MHTFFRQRLSMGLLSTAVMLQGLCSGAVQAQQGDAQGNRPIRLTPAAKRPTEPRRLNNTVMPRANPNPVPNQQPMPSGMIQNPQAGPIPVTATNPRGLQQTAGPQSGASRSEIQQQLDEMYRKEGKQAPQMNYNSLPAVQAAQQAQAQGRGDEGEDEEDEGQQPTGPQQRSGNGARQMPNNSVRGGGANGTIPILPQQQHQSQQSQQHQQSQQQQGDYKEPNLLKRWFGPRKKPEQQQPPQIRPQQFPQQQGQGMNRPQGGMPNQQQQAQQQQQQQLQMQQQQMLQQQAQQQQQQQNFQPQQMNNLPANTPAPQAPAAQVVTPPGQPGRATLNTSNLQRTQPQQQAVRQQPAASRAPNVVVPVQTPAQPAQPAQETDTPASEQPNSQKSAAAQEEEIPRLDEPASEQEVKKEAPVAETKTAETPATPAKKSPFENLEIYEPEQSKPAAEAQPSAAVPEKKEAIPETKQPAPQEQPAANPPLSTPAAETPAAETPAAETPVKETPVATPPATEARPVSTPPGKTSMQDLQTRPQPVLFLDGEDDEQREKYRMLAAFPEKTGFKGFCPTALRDERDLVRGRKTYQLTQHKHVYLFSSARALAAAQSNPEKYLPIADGQDVVLMKEGENVEGSVDAAAWYRGRLYLFASRKNLEMFAANPTLYTGTETVIRTQPAATKHPLKTEEKPAEVATEEDEENEEEEMEENAGPKGKATPMRNQSPASLLNGPGGTSPKSKGSANPVPPPPAHEEAEEPAMPGKKIRAAKFSDNNPTSDRKRTVLRVSVPAG